MEDTFRYELVDHRFAGCFEVVSVGDFDGFLIGKIDEVICVVLLLKLVSWLVVGQ